MNADKHRIFERPRKFPKGIVLVVVLVLEELNKIEADNSAKRSRLGSIIVIHP